MKVVFLADSISEQSAGIHYYGIQLIEQIVSNYPLHEYLAISAKEIKVGGVRNIVMPISGIPLHYRIRQFTSIPDFIHQHNADVVIELAHFGPFRLNKRIKRITVIHDLGPLTHCRFHSLSSYLAHKLLLRKILDNATEIIVNSSTTKESISNYYGSYSDKIQICYPRIRTQKSNIDKAILDAPYFLSIGTIEPRKNYFTLLKAYKLYRDQGGALKLVIIGKRGWKTNRFFRSYNNHVYNSDIVLTGYVSRTELLNYIEHSQAFISASYFEGFDLPVYESMKFSKQLILSKIPVHEEIAEGCGLFFNPNDENELADLLLNFKKFSKSHLSDLNRIEQNSIKIHSLLN